MKCLFNYYIISILKIANFARILFIFVLLHNFEAMKLCSLTDEFSSISPHPSLCRSSFRSQPFHWVARDEDERFVQVDPFYAFRVSDNIFNDLYTIFHYISPFCIFFSS